MFTREMSAFVIEVESVDRQLGEWVYDRFNKGDTLEQIKMRLQAVAKIAGRK